jgi:hypothetical protein
MALPARSVSADVRIEQCSPGFEGFERRGLVTCGRVILPNRASTGQDQISEGGECGLRHGVAISLGRPIRERVERLLRSTPIRRGDQRVARLAAALGLPSDQAVEDVCG